MAIRNLFSSTSVLALFFVALQFLPQSGYSMQLKYQYLIDEFQMTNQCPGDDCAEIEMTAYRWVHSPITHELNFLPNIEYDRKRKKSPPRLLMGDLICSRCGASFFTTEKKARKRLKEYKDNLEIKHQQFVNYTHIAKGDIKRTDGVATKIKKEHFGFYEYEKCDMKKTFDPVLIPV